MIEPTAQPAGAVDNTYGDDRAAIMRLIHRFENAFDLGDFDAHLATWADDMSFGSPFGDFETKADYEQWLRGFYTWAQENYGGTRHLITNFDIAVDGDDAVSICYLTVLARQGPVIAATSVCRDTLRKTDGAWLLIRRDLTVDQDLSPS
ncbi:MAG: nuclear transport factor 2 family protein [Phycicoccus sp.]